MNLNMIRPENDTEDLLLSITKTEKIPIEQTHRKADETLEFKLNQAKETFVSIHVSRLKDLGWWD